MKPIPSIFSISLVRFGLLVVLIILIHYALLLPALFLLFLLLTVENMRFWSRAALRKLSSTTQLSPARLFVGETAEFSLSLENRGLLPVLLSWELPLPPEILPESGAPTDSTVLKWRSSSSATVTIHAQQRGIYFLPPLPAVSWDALSLFPRTTMLGGETTLLIYPKLLPLPELSLKPSGYVGLHQDKRPILPDPIRVAGLREYTADLPARLIHWKASAQKDRLLARITEPSADLYLCVAVAADDFGPGDAVAFETALSLAATLICQADETHIPFALCVNAKRIGLSGPTFLPLGSGPEHLAEALENLARLTSQPEDSLDNLLSNPVNRLPWGTSLLVLGTAREFSLLPGLGSPIFYDIRPFISPKPSPQERNDPYGATFL